MTLVMDNLNTHSLASLYEAFSPGQARALIDRLEVVYTPKHGSWLNMAEIELGVLSSQCMGGRIPDRQTLADHVNHWQEERNRSVAKIDWRFTTTNARIKLRHLYPKLTGDWTLVNGEHAMKRTTVLLSAVAAVISLGQALAAEKKDNVPPPGYKALFNGKDLTGWKGLVRDPKARAKMTPDQLARAQKRADKQMRDHWKVVDGELVYDGKGNSLCTIKDYADFEFLVDWKIKEKGDSGIYLRGSPQVQIWDPANFKLGSGGLYNNQKNPSKPLMQADKPIGEWNTFYIKMVGDRVTVKLNGKVVVKNTVLENYWERGKPIYPTGQIELQHHGNTLWFKNVFIRELPKKSGAK